MATLRIYDCDSGVLAVDLRHLIDLLTPRSRQATWTVSPVKLFYPENNSFEEDFDATGKGGEQLEVLARDGSPVSGTILAQLANDTGQVIWGEFTAALPQQDGWITVQAIDSTFYEVTTMDAAVLNKIKSAYKDVRAAVGPAASIPIPQVQREDQR
jgi:hypothetical protein